MKENITVSYAAAAARIAHDAEVEAYQAESFDYLVDAYTLATRRGFVTGQRVA